MHIEDGLGSGEWEGDGCSEEGAFCTCTVSACYERRYTVIHHSFRVIHCLAAVLFCRRGQGQAGAQLGGGGCQIQFLV